MHRLLLAPVIVLAAATAEAGRPVAQPWIHLRSLSAASQALAAAAIARSPLVRAFVDDIERSDVMVYLEVLTAPPENDLHGSMRFVTWTGGIRYLFVEVDGYRMAQVEQIAILGHELCHAIEVARAPDVRDAAAFRRLYEAIGTEWGTSRFETANARDAERRVRDDVASGRSNANRAGTHT